MASAAIAAHLSSACRLLHAHRVSPTYGFLLIDDDENECTSINSIDDQESNAELRWQGPLESLLSPGVSEEFAHWESLARSLPELLNVIPIEDRSMKGSAPGTRNDTGRASLVDGGSVREAVAQLPFVDWTPLKEHRAGAYRALRLAFLQLSMIASAFIWDRIDAGAPSDSHGSDVLTPYHDGTTAAVSLPPQISIPLCGIAAELGMAPVLVHASAVLCNWTRIDSTGPLSLDNLRALIGVCGGRDEEWFFLVTVAVEAAGGRAVLPALLLQQSRHDFSTAMNQRHTLQEGANMWLDSVASWLRDVKEGIRGMTAAFKRMPEHCRPSVFYDIVRPFLSGAVGNPAFRGGVVYTGVFDDCPQFFHGGSAAQSTLLPVFDALFGIQHASSTSSAFFKEMQEHYMPTEHASFARLMQSSEPHTESLGDLLRRFSIEAITEEAISAKLKNTVDEYKNCVGALVSFRNVHLAMVRSFILQEQNRTTAKDAPIADLQGQGTGGTGIMSFLLPVRDATRERLLR